jgi:hypothetical protein
MSIVTMTTITYPPKDPKKYYVYLLSFIPVDPEQSRTDELGDELIDYRTDEVLKVGELAEQLTIFDYSDRDAQPIVTFPETAEKTDLFKDLTPIIGNSSYNDKIEYEEETKGTKGTTYSLKNLIYAQDFMHSSYVGSCNEYLHYSTGKMLYYIGETCNIDKRMNNHASKRVSAGMGTFTKICNEYGPHICICTILKGPVNYWDAAILEGRYIQSFISMYKDQVLNTNKTKREITIPTKLKDGTINQHTYYKDRTDTPGINHIRALIEDNLPELRGLDPKERFTRIFNQLPSFCTNTELRALLNEYFDDKPLTNKEKKQKATEFIEKYTAELEAMEPTQRKGFIVDAVYKSGEYITDHYIMMVLNDLFPGELCRPTRKRKSGHTVP